VTEAPLDEVTVSTYDVVTEGETFTAVPLVTARLPGVITPLPFEKTPVRLALPPAATVVGLAVKLAIAGAEALTVTVAIWVIESPAEFVTVSV
jgi:hypothetical protein